MNSLPPGAAVTVASMKIPPPFSLRAARRFATAIALVCGLSALSLAQAQEAAAPFYTPAAAGSLPAIAPNGSGSEGVVTWNAGPQGIEVTIPPQQKTSFPGILLTPGTPWDGSKHGRVEARITNLGADRLRVSFRIDDSTRFQDAKTSAEVVGIPPGESRVVSVYYGYSYGQYKSPFDASHIAQAIVFGAKMDKEQKFRIEEIRPAGSVGEAPKGDPSTAAVKPPQGVLFGPGIALEAAQLKPAGGAKAVKEPGTNALRIDFSGASGEAVLFKPAVGFWNLNQHLRVKVKVQNAGSAPVQPAVRIESRGGPSGTVSAAAPIAPGREAEIAVPFEAKVPWRGISDPDQLVLEVKKDWEGEPGTGTKYASNVTTGITILPGGAGGAKALRITSITADVPPAPELPAWLGQRPPVEGEWVKTFEDNFEGNTLDLTKWNTYTDGAFHIGKHTHYSKDNVIVKDGKVRLHLEKKHGHHNDDPTMEANDIATGYLDTFGKWTQRYGYFEARMKNPTAPNMFLAYWLMPDRGLGKKADFKRDSTRGKGMEFDIMETLSIWGPYRHDFGMHFDNYDKYHKTCGTLNIYFQPDKEGFVTVGMLWLPGQVVLYDNGKETARWESPRIGAEQQYIIFDLVTGGWETEALDEKQLPQDYVIDYVRVWQRKDLASDADGAKPNTGTNHSPKL